jgi:hypothetical protein
MELAIDVLAKPVCVGAVLAGVEVVRVLVAKLIRG